MEARNLARLALDKRLAACANIFPVTSLYWWKGEVEETAESALVLKTRAGLVRALVAELKKAHSYEVPCIEVLPVLAEPECAAWLVGETRRRA